MITKKLLHDIVTFCNNYIDNKNIVINITKYIRFIDVNFSVWSITNGVINKNIGNVDSYIRDIDDFNKFKEKVLNELPLLLKQVKEN